MKRDLENCIVLLTWALCTLAVVAAFVYSVLALVFGWPPIKIPGWL